jgi:hypothetical protein
MVSDSARNPQQTRIGDQSIAPAGRGFIGENLDRLRERADRSDASGTAFRSGKSPQAIRCRADELARRAEQHLCCG